ncbi:cytochrome P450 [Rhexocercosporidium sp. MPI-PUGE-AT-0058]|nr:cytochrome P450 [Rhexocercosporidium sp. MPI-PUGE-AT-0058]
MYKTAMLDKSVQTGGAICSLVIIYVVTKVIWRLCFHPLSKYPGPKPWAVTSLINTFYVFKATRIYKISELHNKYGPVVRVGPNELSYVDEQAWKGIYSAHKPGGELQKHMPAINALGGYGIFHNPNDAEHARIRKLLSTGFSEKAIRDREGIIQRYISLLMTRMRERAGRGDMVDATWWFDCLGADLAGELGYGESFGALETSTLPDFVPVIDKLLRGLTIGLALGQYPILRNIGGVLRKMSPFEGIFKEIVGSKVGRREKRFDAGQTAEVRDFYSLLTRNEGEAVQQLSPKTIRIISGDLIVGGSDTTATGLSVAIYLLLKNPSKLEILTKEIRSAFTSEDEITMISTNSLKYQSAVISESMRMYPAGPETTRRITNDGGNVICGQFVPGGTLVGVYHWAAGHNKAAWKDADSFVPERWLGDKRYEGDVRGVLNVWNSGPRNCLGQNFALAHMKLVLARLIWTFDLELCSESEDYMNVGASVLVYHKGPLMIRMKSVRGGD